MFLGRCLKTFSPFRSIEINNNLNFVLSNFSCNFERDGNSLTQGAHQVAQKFIRVQVFLKSRRVTFWPDGPMKGVEGLSMGGLFSMNLIISPDFGGIA